MFDREYRHQLLVKARNILEKRGLALGELEDAEGHVCMIGAINMGLTGSVKDNGMDPDRRQEFPFSLEAGVLFRSLANDMELPDQGDTAQRIYWISDQCAVQKDRSALEYFDKGIKNTAPEPEDPQTSLTEELGEKRDHTYPLS